MSESPILAIPEVEELQNNKFLTINDAISLLEASTNDIYANAAVGAGPLTLTEAQATRYHVYKVSGAANNYNLTLPVTINGNNAKRVFAVHNNDTTYTVTVKPVSGSGTTVVLLPGQAALIYQTYEDMVALSRAGLTVPYDLGFFVPASPEDGGMVLKFTAVRAVTIPADFAGSLGHCEVVPSDGDAVFDVQKNGSSVGSITINTSGVFAFTTSATPVSLAVNDRLSIIAPTPQDSTLADVNVNILASRAA